jgi:hypothetical protein
MRFLRMKKKMPTTDAAAMLPPTPMLMTTTFWNSSAPIESEGEKDLLWLTLVGLGVLEMGGSVLKMLVISVLESEGITMVETTEFVESVLMIIGATVLDVVLTEVAEVVSTELTIIGTTELLGCIVVAIWTELMVEVALSTGIVVVILFSTVLSFAVVMLFKKTSEFEPVIK